MATTNLGFTTPALGSANNVPADLGSLATQVDAAVWARTQPNTLIIGGVAYQASGTWAQQELSSPTVTAGAVHAWTITKTAPYTPPAGYTFQVFLVFSSGFTSAQTGHVAGGNIEVRVININSNEPTIILGWRLTKA